VTSIRASDLIGERIQQIRLRRGMTARQLAARCKEIGAPEITAPVIANIETGRRGPDGKRRRQVTVDELLILAFALEVPPLLLLLPRGGTETLGITPSASMDLVTAAAWASGDDNAFRAMSGQPVPATDDDRKRWFEWRRAARPVDMLRNLWLWLQMWAEEERSADPLVTGDVERANRLHVLADRAIAREHGDPPRQVVQVIVNLMNWLFSLGFEPPPLPRRIAEHMKDGDLLEHALEYEGELLIAGEQPSAGPEGAS
jgi:transcriptional regulator with XRE-family HTH domain